MVDTWLDFVERKLQETSYSSATKAFLRERARVFDEIVDGMTDTTEVTGAVSRR